MMIQCYANMHFYDLKSVLAKNDNVRLILSSKYKRLLAMENTFTCMIILYNFTFTFETRQINIFRYLSLITGAVAKRTGIIFIAIFRSILLIHSSYVIFIP